MGTYDGLRILVLIDFDKDGSRLDSFMDSVEAELRKRFFVLGAFSNIVKLKRQADFYGRNEELGRILLKACGDKDNPHCPWQSPELKLCQDQIRELAIFLKNNLLF